MDPPQLSPPIAKVLQHPTPTLKKGGGPIKGCSRRCTSQQSFSLQDPTASCARPSSNASMSEMLPNAERQEPIPLAKKSMRDSSSSPGQVMMEPQTAPAQSVGRGGCRPASIAEGAASSSSQHSCKMQWGSCHNALKCTPPSAPLKNKAAIWPQCTISMKKKQPESPNKSLYMGYPAFTPHSPQVPPPHPDPKTSSHQPITCSLNTQSTPIHRECQLSQYISPTNNQPPPQKGNSFHAISMQNPSQPRAPRSNPPPCASCGNVFCFCGFYINHPQERECLSRTPVRLTPMSPPPFSTPQLRCIIRDCNNSTSSLEDEVFE